jgi:hypothetical protein
VSDEAFEPDECEVFAEDDKVRIRFARDDGSSREILLQKGQAPSLAELLISKTESSRLVRIDQRSLRPGQTFVVQSFRVQKISDGSRLLTMTVFLSDQNRIVTIPLELSTGNAQLLVQQIK